MISKHCPSCNIIDIALEGVFPKENDGYHDFSWTEQNFAIQIPENIYYISIEAYTPAENASLFLTESGKIISTTPLQPIWTEYCIDVREVDKNCVKFTVDKIYEVDNDPRKFGVCIRKITFLKETDWQKAKQLEEKQKNYILNEQEFKEGVSIVKSYPPLLAIAIENKCQIAAKEPCTYCNWDSKEEGKKLGVKFDAKFIRAFSKYFDNAIRVTDCSIGEPLLNKNLPEIIDEITGRGANFTFTTNAQFLTEERQGWLLGKNINMSVSLDAATAETYAKYRHSGFEKVITNLTSLCQKKKNANNLPHVTCAFIVMNSNKHEIPAYIKLMSEIGIDAIVFSELITGESLMDIRRKSRSGYEFIYKDEVVPQAELAEILKMATSIGKEFNIKILGKSDNFREISTSHGVNSQPLCTEPWKAAYLLSHEITYCCYGVSREYWDTDEQHMVERFNAVFNGEIFQEIRRNLAQGKLSKYCRKSSFCPIVMNCTHIDRDS